MFSDNKNLKDFVKDKHYIPEIDMDAPMGELFFYNLIDVENVMNLEEKSEDIIDKSTLKSFDDYITLLDKFKWKKDV